MEKVVKGFNVPDGYMGWIGNNYMLFASERDYLDFIED